MKGRKRRGERGCVRESEGTEDGRGKRGNDKRGKEIEERNDEKKRGINERG